MLKMTLREYNEKQEQLKTELQRLNSQVRFFRFFEVCKSVVENSTFFTTSEELAQSLADEMEQMDEPFTKEEVLDVLRFVDLDLKFVDLFRFVSDEAMDEFNATERRLAGE